MYPLKSDKSGKKATSLGNRSTENLCPEEGALRALDDLLVDAHGWVIHDDSAFLVIDLCVDAGVADEVDDPFLTLSGVEVEAGGEVPWWALA